MAKKLPPEGYPKALQTIGDHLRKRRLDLKLFQKDVARMVGVDTNSITNWEKNRSRPRLYLLPKVFEFLGYDPMPASSTTIGGKLKEYRRKNGLSIKKLARKLDIDPSTLASWERNSGSPNEKHIYRLIGLLRIQQPISFC